MYQGSLTVEKRDDNEYYVEFRNVSFKYPNTEAYVLKNVNLKFKIGEKLAIVGMNGSGKTTFIKLLCRLYDPTEGEILLNGVNIQKYDYDEYMSVFSVVFQDFSLFSFKIGEVVASSKTFDENKVRECLVKANFGDRLHEMPEGIHTYLYKGYDQSGIEISGGEAQKIALARALIKTHRLFSWTSLLLHLTRFLNMKCTRISMRFREIKQPSIFLTDWLRAVSVIRLWYLMMEKSYNTVHMKNFFLM